MGGTRKKRWKKILLGAVLGIGGALVFLHLPVGSGKIKISPGTTFVEGPLNPDGTVNYVAALDGMFAEGVSPEDNAGPDLLRAFGPSALEPRPKDEVFRLLGLPTEGIIKGQGAPIKNEVLGRLGLAPEDIGEGIFILWEKRARPTSRKAAGPRPTFTCADGSEIDLREASLADVRKMLCQGSVHPELEGWLRKNADALQLIEQTTTTKTRLYIPLVSSSRPVRVFDIATPFCTYFRGAAQALAARALWRRRNGDQHGAWTDVLTAHRLARLLGQSPMLIDRLAAFGMESVPAKTGIALATQAPLGFQEARKVLTEVDSLSPCGSAADAIDRSDRFMVLDTIMMLSRGQRIGALEKSRHSLRTVRNLDWNEMLRQVNRWYDRTAKALATPRLAGRAEAVAQLSDQARQVNARLHSKAYWAKVAFFKVGGWPFRSALSKEVVDILLWMMWPTLSRVCELQDEATMVHRIETTALALACFRAEHGHWPSSLSELSPAFLKAVPMDVFSRDTLVYQASDQGYLLYSVGINGRDDGGIRDQKADKDDIAAQVPAGECPALTTATTQPTPAR